MKILSCFLLSLLICVSAHAQKDVTKFLGFPVDGTKSEMIRKLKTKGFKVVNDGKNNLLTGKFNGNDVYVNIVTENGKVSRIMINDQHPVSETDIKIRFNKLFKEFENNGKYLIPENFTIPENEDISYEMTVNKKRYEATFYQLPEGETLDNLENLVAQNIISKYSAEQLRNASDELKSEIFNECYLDVLNTFRHKLVWFMIRDFYGEYYISIFYDNELNRAHGEDL